MCRFCTSDTTSKADIERGLEYAASQLNRMAEHLLNMAAGRIKPHTPQSAAITPLAHAIIRMLVDDWM